MTDTKELLKRIAALRSRMNCGSDAQTMTPHESLRAVEAKVERGAVHNAMLDASLRSAEPTQQSIPATLRLTGRGARVLRKGSELIQALRRISDDPHFQGAANAEGLAECHRQATALIEVILRTAQAMPTSVSGQLRMCDGLEVVLGEVEERITRLCNQLGQQKRNDARIDELADCLRRLAVNQTIGLTPVQKIADLLLDEARTNQPLRFLNASPEDPARFAAAHSLNVGQVMARVLRDDVEWQPQLQLAVMTALVHDVGMVRVPADILLTEGPLTDDQRRIVEKHTIVAESMLESLWPGGGWPVEAAGMHHERNDGTGYPLGRPDIQLPVIVRLLAVCDVYAALCAPRPHRLAFDTRTALTETLLLAEREHLDKPSAERLLALSFYPVGSVVELNDGAIGMVVATHSGSAGLTNPSRPIVYLVADANGQPLPWPTIIDLLQQKDRGIVRSLNADERWNALGEQFPQVA